MVAAAAAAVVVVLVVVVVILVVVVVRSTSSSCSGALALRYGWRVKGLPKVNACVENFDERHAMSCQKGGFISIRHDDIRDITCSLLKEVCSILTKEPLLQPLQGEEFNYKTAKVEQEEG